MSGNPSQSSGMGNGVGNMSQLASAMGAQPQGAQTFPTRQMPSSGGAGMAAGMSTGSQGLPSIQSLQQTPFTVPSAANPTNTTATQPTLTGGYWNQMAQMLAGPSYKNGGTGAVMPTGTTGTGTTPVRTGIQPIGIGGGAGGNRYVSMR